MWVLGVVLKSKTNVQKKTQATAPALQITADHDITIQEIVVIEIHAPQLLGNTTSGSMGRMISHICGMQRSRAWCGTPPILGVVNMVGTRNFTCYMGAL